MGEEQSVEARLARLVRTAKIDDAGMGEVWLATSPDHGDVVVKIFDLARIDAPNLGVRVRRALPFLQNHSCSNLPKTFDGGVLQSAVFLVFERIAGTSLARIFDTVAETGSVAGLFDPRGPRLQGALFDPADAARIAVGVLGALKAALEHRDVERDVAAPLIHGGVSARKVIVGSDGHVTLLGLGTAPLSRTGPIVDPEAFDTAAPELARQDPATPSSDVYAVGALLFRMLTGVPPVGSGSVVKRIRALVKGERQQLLDLVPDLPPELVAIIDKALAASPADRYLSASAMFVALSDWLAQSDATAVVQRADETLSWALDAIDHGNLESVARLLHDRPELGRMPAFTRALWNATADVLLDPLLDGRPLTRVQSILLAHLPEAATDLIGLVADMEVNEGIRVSAARILGAMGATEAAPFLVRVLNEPFPWLRVATLDALAQLPTPQPIGFDDVAGRVVPCRRAWDDLGPEKNGRRVCDRCNTPCVLSPNLLALAPEADAVLLGAEVIPSDCTSVTLMSLDGERTLSVGEVATMGSDDDASISHKKLDRHHATLRLLPDGRVIVRRVGETIHAGDLEEIAIQTMPHGEGECVGVGPVELMTRPNDSVLILHAADGELKLQDIQRNATLDDTTTADGANGTTADTSSRGGVFGGLKRWMGGGDS